MQIGNVQISRSFVISGKPLPIANGLSVKHPTVREILSLEPELIADALYLNYVSTFAVDPYDYMVWLDDRGVDYEKTTAFDVFMMRSEESVRETGDVQNDAVGQIFKKASFAAALDFFLGEHEWQPGVDSEGNKLLFDKNDPTAYIDRERFDMISAFVRMINNISERKDKIKPASESAKKILIEDMRDEEKRAKNKKKDENDSSDYIGDAIEAVIHGGSGGVTWFNYRELPIYEIMSGLNITQKQIAFNALLTGVYTGNVKSDSITQKEMAWMK